MADGRCLLASGDKDHTIRLWDPATGGAFGAPLTGHSGRVASLAGLTLRDGRCLLASGSEDRTIRLWDPAMGCAFGAPLIGHTGDVTSVAETLLADGRCLLASGSWDGTIRLWDVANCRTLHVWGLGFPVDSLAWVSGRLFAAGKSNLIAIETE
jgi:WD40 repeat protein